MLTDTDAGERPSPHRRDLTVGTLTGKGSLMPPHPATVLRADTTDIAEPGRVWVSLFGVPYVSVDGERLDVPEGSKRLLAFVCLGGRRIERRRAAGVLWPDGDDVRAAGNLRSALWRLKGCGIDVVDSDKVLLWLREDAVVDVEVMQGWATRLIAGQPEPADLDVRCWHADQLELLPGWYDDWALFERERLRQLLLHALEAMARQLIARDRAAEAVTVALAAVAAEPLRESAQRVLVDGHLAEGNLCEARRAYEAYRVLARRELGVEPGGSLRSAVATIAVDGTGPAAPPRSRSATARTAAPRAATTPAAAAARSPTRNAWA